MTSVIPLGSELILLKLTLLHSIQKRLSLKDYIEEDGDIFRIALVLQKINGPEISTVFFFDFAFFFYFAS